MATGYIQLSPQAALLPTSNFPILKRHASSGTGVPEMWILEFPDAADDYCYFAFIVPVNYASAPVLKIYWMAVEDTANECRWGVQVTCGSDDADDWDTIAADTENVVDDTAPSVAGEHSICSVTLTNVDSMAAGDFCIIRVRRNGTHANDDMTDPAQFMSAILEYTLL